MENKIFLGGTYGKTDWRSNLMGMVQVPHFNPIVEDWTPECREKEIEEREKHCNVHFYLINNEMSGVFSIAEVTDSAHMEGKVTILHVMPYGFDVAQLKSLNAVISLIQSRGGIAYMDNELQRSARVLNYCFKEYSDAAT